MRHRFVLSALVLTVALGTAAVRAEEKPPAWRLSATVEPFEGPVRDYAISPDATRLITVGNDHRVRLWDLATGETIAAFDRAGDPWNGLLAFSPDSRLVASLVPSFGRKDPYGAGLRVWSAADGAPLTGWRETRLAEGTEHMPARLFHHASGAVVFDPGQWAREIVVASTPTLRSPPIPPRREWSIAPDGATVYLIRGSGIVGGSIPSGMRRDGLTMRAYAVKDGARRYTTTFDDRDVPQGTPFLQDICATGVDEVAYAKGGVIHVFALPSKKLKHRFGEDVTALAYGHGHWFTGHEDGRVEQRKGRELLRRVATGHGRVQQIKRDGDALMLRTSKGHALVRGDRVVWRASQSIEGHVHGDSAVVRWHDGRTTVNRAGRPDWELKSDRPEYAETDRRNRPALLAGRTMAVLRGGRLQLYDLGTQKPGHVIGGHAGRITHADWRGGRLLARGGTKGYYVSPLGTALIDPADGNAISRAASGEAHLAGDTLTPLPAREYKKRGGVVVSPDGKRSARWEGTGIVLYDGVLGTRRRVFPAEHNRHGVELAFDPKSERLAAAWVGRRPGVLDVRIRVWDLATAEVAFEHVLPRKSYPVKAVRWSPDGRWLGAQLRQLRIYDAKGVERHVATVGPANQGSPWAFTPDGRHVVGASFAGPVEVFDLEAGKTVHAFDMPRETYSHWVRLTMAPDGKAFALYYSERRLAFWISIAKGQAGMTRFETWARHGDRHVVDFAPNGDLAVFTKAGIEIWDALTRKRRELLDGVNGSMVRVSGDGRRIAVVDDARLRLFVRGE